MTEQRKWYALDTGGGEPYLAIGPFQSYAVAEEEALEWFGTHALVKVRRSVAKENYRF